MWPPWFSRFGSLPANPTPSGGRYGTRLRCPPRIRAPPRSRGRWTRPLPTSESLAGTVPLQSRGSPGFDGYTRTSRATRAYHQLHGHITRSSSALAPLTGSPVCGSKPCYRNAPKGACRCISDVPCVSRSPELPPAGTQTVAHSGGLSPGYVSRSTTWHNRALWDTSRSGWVTPARGPPARGSGTASISRRPGSSPPWICCRVPHPWQRGPARGRASRPDRDGTSV